MSDRIANPPVPLPIDAALPALRQALAAGHAVLTAPPGSGKTTRVPLALLAEPWLQGKRILMLEPRRPAARLAARHMAATLGEPPGETVGYQVRFERCAGPKTRIEVLTEGILTRRLQSDPELADTGLVIFDEVHERNLQADLGLALCLDVIRNLRADLRLLVMSATLDPGPLETLLPASRVTAEGRAHPVQEHYLGTALRDRDRIPAVAGLVRRALSEQSGDVLVFLPGKAEIGRVAATLNDQLDDCRVLALHGDLPVAEQDRVLQPTGGGERRVVLSTDLAETSVTIPGIGAVVDAGLARKPRFDPNTGLTRLETRRVARAAATQRAGRAGRLGPGVCYRAWTVAEHDRLAEAGEPEIRNADLAPLVLELANWGVSDPHALSWPDPPPAANWAQAVALLQRLEALDAAGRITTLGRYMATVPAHPRLAHLMSAAAAPNLGVVAADLAALLSERDPRRSTAASDLDLQIRLEALAAWRSGRASPQDFDARALRRVDRTAQQLRRYLPARLADAPPWSVGALVSLAFPDRIAQRRSGTLGRFLLANGREARLPESDPLAAADFLVIPALDAGSREGRAWLAVACPREELEAVHGPRIQTRLRLFWDDDREAVAARREQRLESLLLESAATPIADPEAAAGLLLDTIRARGLETLNWSEAATQLRARLATLRLADSAGGWPDVSDDALKAGLADWLQPWLNGATSLKDARRVDLHAALLGLLDWPQRQRLDAQAPTHYETPAGTRRRLRYELTGPPSLQAPLQELFGLDDGPRVAGGVVAVVIHLLSPAGRPLQITRDLRHFWRNGYVEVRKEMRGRYPKHDWPEDPTLAVARPGGRKQRR